MSKLSDAVCAAAPVPLLSIHAPAGVRPNEMEAAVLRLEQLRRT